MIFFLNSDTRAQISMVLLKIRVFGVEIQILRLVVIITLEVRFQLGRTNELSLKVRTGFPKHFTLKHYFEIEDFALLNYSLQINAGAASHFQSGNRVVFLFIVRKIEKI